MNLQHIRYALEVSRTGSITQAAENLYMNQPNLSKAIREFEEELGYKIFNRTTKGMTTTKKGEIFLLRGKKILSDIKDLEDLFRFEEGPSGISIVVPRYFPLSGVMDDLLSSIKDNHHHSWHIMEMDDDNAIQQIMDGQSRLGILRYPSMYDLNVRQYLQAKGLGSKLLAQNGSYLVFSNKSPLAKFSSISKENVAKHIEIQLYIKPSRHLPENPGMNEASVDGRIGKKLTFLLNDTSTALEALVYNSNTYMVAPSPLPTRTLERYKLSQTGHWDDSKSYMNRLIYEYSHTFTPEENRVIKQIAASFIEGNATLLYDKENNL